MPRCATPSPANHTPLQRRDLLLRGTPDNGRYLRFDRAALELLDSAGLLDHPLVREHTDLGMVPTRHGPWWFTTVDWARLSEDPLVTSPSDIDGHLLGLAAGIAAGAPVNLRAALIELGPSHTDAVVAAVSRAAGLGRPITVPFSPSRADSRFTLPDSSPETPRRGLHCPVAGRGADTPGHLVLDLLTRQRAEPS
ncbi:hypothetical protein [Nocardia asteroides]|uniref:hypothetical protein n=1 Tax=Nocardia asteroides TaxID=1824 RepID=UPI00342225D2